MKNFKTIILISSLLITLRSSAQIDNLVNLSPEWVRSGARNAATDGTDIMVYNPGGMAMMKSGFHVGVGNQSFFRKPTHEYNYDYGMGATNYKYAQSGNDMFVPNLYVSYNKDKWALFGGFNISGGGATANYPTGSISTDLVGIQTVMGVNAAYDAMVYTNTKDAHLKASSAYYTTMFGGSYKLNNMISVGLFGRYIMAQNTTQAGVTLMDATGVSPDMPMALNAQYDASGVGVVAGVDIKPTDKLNFAIRYESQTKLDFKTKQIKDDFGITTDGQMNRRDLPGVLGFGVSYAWSDKLKTMADFNYYFQTMADWGTSNVMGENKETSKLAGNAATYSLSFEYKVTSKLMASLGGVYSMFNYTDEAGYYTNLGAFETVPANNFTICTGIGYNATEKIRINAGFLHSFYGTTHTVNVLNLSAPNMPAVVANVKNSISGVAIGADFRF